MARHNTHKIKLRAVILHILTFAFLHIRQIWIVIKSHTIIFVYYNLIDMDLIKTMTELAVRDDFLIVSDFYEKTEGFPFLPNVVYFVQFLVVDRLILSDDL